jgi:hypothetical protein
MNRTLSFAAMLAMLAAPMTPVLANDGARLASQMDALSSAIEPDTSEADISYSYQLQLDNPPMLEINRPAVVRFVLTQNGKPLTPDKLKLVHNQKIHALLADPTLTDYRHVHPKPTNNPGEYVMRFTPKTDRPYLLWLDIAPKDSPQLYLQATLSGSNNETPLIDRTENREAMVGGYHFTLTFDGPVTRGSAVMGQVRVMTAAGEPVTKLEPVMGAFSHIVGIYDDDETITHVHPLGAEPTSSTQRGGPQLDFQLEPKKPGFIKLFAQVQIGGKAYYAPFGVVVE